MSEITGWISLHRQVQKHWIWKDPNKFQWWIDILLTVNNTDCKVNIGFEVLACKRGQSLMSIQSWATRWGVSKDTARNFLNLLEKDHMITRVTLAKTTLLTICNYDSYQQGLHVKKRMTSGSPSDAPTQTIMNNNEYKDINIYSGFIFFNNGFDKVWKDYKEMRVKIKKPLTETAELLNLKDLSKLSNDDKELAIKIVNQSIKNSWQGFFALKNEVSTKPQYTGR
jgi:hypothetical protein